MLSVHQANITVKNGIVGVISDTHGLIRPEALVALQEVGLIIHAGDIGKPEVLQALKAIAPVLAIRGNNDRQGWARELPDVLNLAINGVKLRVIHNVGEIDDDPLACGFCAVISGHSHKPAIITRDKIVFVNPGSAGPRRFKLPVSVARIRFAKNKLRARIIELRI